LAAEADSAATEPTADAESATEEVATEEAPEDKQR
jgi:hypothetical protein